MENEVYVRASQVCAALGVSRPTLNRYLKDGTFPGPDRRITDRNIAWRKSTVDKFLKSKEVTQ